MKMVDARIVLIAFYAVAAIGMACWIIELLRKDAMRNELEKIKSNYDVIVECEKRLIRLDISAQYEASLEKHMREKDDEIRALKHRLEQYDARIALYDKMSRGERGTVKL